MNTKTISMIILSSIILAGITLLMLSLGTAQVPLGTVLAVMLQHTFGVDSGSTLAQQIIVWDIRWQRIALAILVGSGLAVSGSCYQTLFKNPLADPFVLGISSGAALGAAVAIVTQHTSWMILFAFVGALASLGLVFAFSQRSAFIYLDQQLLLAGIACGAMLNAMLCAIMALHSQQMQMIVFWLMGSLSSYVESLQPVLLLVIVGLSIAMVYSRDLDVMTLGDEDARFLGVNVARVKVVLLLSTTIMTGACVAVSGIIGFVGLIVPHMVRKVVGSEHLTLLPLSALWGAILLLVADGMIRTIPLLSGIPVGVVTALFGSPFFLYLLYSSGRRVR